MSKSYDIARGVYQTINTSDFVTKSNGAIEALDGSALTNLTSNNLTGALPALDGSSLTGIAAGGGKVLQVQHYRKDTSTAISGGSSQVIHSGITITPTASDSKVLVIVSGCVEGNGGTSQYVYIRLRNGASELAEVFNAMNYQKNAGERTSFAANYLDSPATTSQVTYNLYHDNGLGTGTYDYTEVNYTLIEIAA